jgi:hypothetical protein
VTPAELRARALALQSVLAERAGRRLRASDATIADFRGRFLPHLSHVAGAA